MVQFMFEEVSRASVRDQRGRKLRAKLDVEQPRRRLGQAQVRAEDLAKVLRAVGG